MGCHHSTPNQMFRKARKERQCLPAPAGAPGEEGRLTKIWKRSGLGRLELDTAGAGDIVSITGAGTARIADTVGSLNLEEALAPGVIEPPTLRFVSPA